MLFVNPVPDTVNCWIFGLADAEPSQAEIVPVAVPAVIIGVTDDGFTVMVKVMGKLLHPGPAEIKFPNEIGCPTEIVEAVVPVVVLITETEFSA